MRLLCIIMPKKPSMIKCMIRWNLSSWVCFFFQAEDGIRDYKVTGVQTCALPIFRVGLRKRADGPVDRGEGAQAAVAVEAELALGHRQHALEKPARPGVAGCRHFDDRSEERRVGKEGRGWWQTDN